MSVGVIKNGQYIKTAGLSKDTPIFTPATEAENGASGLVIAPLKGDQDKFLKGNGTWAEIDTVSPESIVDALGYTPVSEDAIGDLGDAESIVDYVEKNKATIINCTFEVDEEGNLVVVTPDGEEPPQGFSIDENGYLIFNE